jgi:hypothetical protein
MTFMHGYHARIDKVRRYNYFTIFFKFFCILSQEFEVAGLSFLTFFFFCRTYYLLQKEPLFISLIFLFLIMTADKDSWSLNAGGLELQDA